MSRRENKELANTNLKKHGQNHAKITAYRIYKRSTAQKFIKIQTLTTRDCTGPQTNMPKNVLKYVYIIIFADQVFIDPTFFGIFVCGPLQSLVVNVCTNWGNIFGNYFYLSISCLTVLYMAFFFAKLAGTLFMIHTYIHTYTHTLYWASLKRAFQYQYKNKLNKLSGWIN